VGVKKNANILQLTRFPLPLIPSRQPFDALTVPRKIEGGREGRVFVEKLRREDLRS